MEKHVLFDKQNTMNTEIPQFLANSDPAMLVGVGLAIAVAFSMLIWLVYKVRHPSDIKKIEKTIKEISDDYAKDVVLSDGLYGYHFVDYLILLPGKILVLAVQDYEGYIFGGDKIEKWAQVVNNRSFNFDNPLIATHHYVQAVRGICSGVDVTNQVVFTGKSSFPKGIPSGVIEMNNLSSVLESLKGQAMGENPARGLWNKLLENIKQQKIQYQQELSNAA